jgi:hypothetical protein
MPNECSNRLDIYGPENDVAAFVAALDGNESIAETFVPTPTELKGVTSPFSGTEAQAADLTARFGATDWYTWCMKNWGTKWGDYNLDIAHTGADSAQFTYTTAWCPMTVALTTISAQWPTLTFTEFYEEHGDQVMGGTVLKNGQVLNAVEAAEGDWPEWDGTDDEFLNYDEKINDLRDQIISDVEIYKEA